MLKQPTGGVALVNVCLVLMLVRLLSKVVEVQIVSIKMLIN
jgi:hypothetical protein